MKYNAAVIKTMFINNWARLGKQWKQPFCIIGCVSCPISVMWKSYECQMIAPLDRCVVCICKYQQRQGIWKVLCFDSLNYWFLVGIAAVAYVYHLISVSFWPPYLNTARIIYYFTTALANHTHAHIYTHTHTPISLARLFVQLLLTPLNTLCILLLLLTPLNTLCILLLLAPLKTLAI